MTLAEFDALSDEDAIYAWAKWKVHEWLDGGPTEVVQLVALRTLEHAWPRGRADCHDEMLESEVFEE